MCCISNCAILYLVLFRKHVCFFFFYFELSYAFRRQGWLWCSFRLLFCFRGNPEYFVCFQADSEMGMRFLCLDALQYSHLMVKADKHQYKFIESFEVKETFKGHLM